MPYILTDVQKAGSNILIAGSPMSFYVYEYKRGKEGHKARVHRASCSWCKGGIGHHEQRAGKNRTWSERFDSIREALEAAQKTGGKPSLCERCCPDYKSRYLYLAEN